MPPFKSSEDKRVLILSGGITYMIKLFDYENYGHELADYSQLKDVIEYFEN